MRARLGAEGDRRARPAAARTDRARRRRLAGHGRRLYRKPDERRVGLVFQEYALFPHLTVRPNVAYAGKERADEYLERFRIAHLANARPATLSGGERQRVGLARALARGPGVILLDEPLQRSTPTPKVPSARAPRAPARARACPPSSSLTTSRTPRPSPTGRRHRRRTPPPVRNPQRARRPTNRRVRRLLHRREPAARQSAATRRRHDRCPARNRRARLLNRVGRR